MAGGYKKLWTTVIETPSFSPPLVSARLVLVEGGAALVGLDPASGAQRWTIPFGSPQRRLAWSLLTPDGPIFCAGKEDLWRITAVDNDGQKRWTGLVEAVRTTAVAIGGKLWVLADGESSCIRLFSEQGEMEGMWEVPKGGGGLVAEEGALLFLVQNSEEDSLFRFTTVDKKIQRIYAGELDSVLSIDGYRLLRGKARDLR